MNNVDIATGKLSTLQSGPDVYKSTGTVDTLSVKQPAPPPPEPTCYIFSLQSTCTKEQLQAVLAGRAVIKDFTVVDIKGKSNGTGTAPKKNGAGSNGIMRETLCVALFFAVAFAIQV
jgi:hypothetical protein